MDYLFRIRLRKPADMTPEAFYAVWLAEAEPSLAALESGALKDIYKVAGQDEAVGIMTLESSEQLDAIYDLPLWASSHSHVVESIDPSSVDALDRFDALVAHLSTVHPSRYVRLVEGLDSVGFEGVHPFTSQTDALRFVAFVDRLYDAQVRIHATGTPLDQVFPDDMLAGGYRKKYLRATSRLIALTSG